MPAPITRPGLKPKEEEEIRQAFDMFDTDKKGKINPNDLKKVM